MDIPMQPLFSPTQPLLTPKRPLIDADSAEDFAHQAFRLWRAGLIQARPNYANITVEFEIGRNPALPETIPMHVTDPETALTTLSDTTKALPDTTT